MSNSFSLKKKKKTFSEQFLSSLLGRGNSERISDGQLSKKEAS